MKTWRLNRFAVLVVGFALSHCLLLPAQGQVPGILNYQGRVVVNGTNFNGTGQFKFALVDGGTNTSRQATAVAYLVTDLVLSNSVTDGGAGYTTAPGVSYSGGGGAGATAYALVGGGAVTAVVRVLAGSGYTTPPTVVLDPPPVNLSYRTFWSNGASAVSLTVTKGLYSVLLGDTGVVAMAAITATVFTNTDVRLRVWFNDGSGMQQLSPDQRIAAVGYALMAEQVNAAGLVGTLPDARLSTNVALLSGSASFAGTVTAAGFTGNGAGMTNLNLAASSVTSAKIADGTISNLDLSAQTISNTFWRLAGNAGTTTGTHFIGTTDNTALEVKVNGARALRIEPTSSGAPNMIGGAAANTVGTNVAGATIGGGGQNSIEIETSYAVIGGGSFNSILDGAYSTVIGGGYDNNIQDWSFWSVIGGGAQNSIDFNAYEATIGGGHYNTIQAGGATIGGGAYNNIQTNAGYATIGGGYYNSIYPFAAYSLIGGGSQNSIQDNANLSVIGGGYLNSIQINAAFSVIGGGVRNSIQLDADYATISGGHMNSIMPTANYSTIGGGLSNIIQTFTYWSMIGGGSQNSIQDDSDHAVISGGKQNTIQPNADYSVIGGGYQNTIQTGADFSTIGGGHLNTIQTNADDSVIGGGILNSIKDGSFAATIGGGYQNIIYPNADYTVVGGGLQNSMHTNTYYSTISGGYDNSIQTNSRYATISGGWWNSILADSSAATICGGYRNNATNDYATVAGGRNNEAGGNNSFAAGCRAKARHTGAFVWGDATDADIASTNSNSVTMRAAGGYRLFSNSGATLGVMLATNATAWASLSDRNAKENFQPINTAEVLDKVAQLPLTTWSYKADPGHRRYLGPVAQDFHASFDLGDDTSINTLDTDGVTLAAIQALHQQLQVEKARSAELEQRLKELEAKVK